MYQFAVLQPLSNKVSIMWKPCAVYFMLHDPCAFYLTRLHDGVVMEGNPLLVNHGYHDSDVERFCVKVSGGVQCCRQLRPYLSLFRSIR